MELSEGSLDRIMNGEDVESPILQVLGHKKLASSTTGERYRLLLSDGIKQNSFTMLATQLNDMVTQNILSEFSIVKINRYALSTVNNSGTQKKVMVILNIEVLKSGDEVGKGLGNVQGEANGKPEEPAKQPAAKPVPTVGTTNPPQRYPPQRNQLNDSISSGGINVSPIQALSPYQNRWVIKVRVTNKSPIRTWSNSRGEGKLFSMDLLDESGEIRCTGFKDACDKYYDIIEVGKIYYISKCTLKPANKQFNYLKNDYEMTLNNDSEIIPCLDDNDEMPKLSFDFVKINEIESRQKDELIDVLGVVKSTSDVQTLNQRSTGRELKKRDLGIVDDSNTMITLTLWGKQAEDFDGSNNPIVAVKGAKIGEFNGGKSLSLLGSSVFQIDPDEREAHLLRGWFKNIGHNAESNSISKFSGSSGNMNGPWFTFKEAQEERLGSADRPNVYIVKATVNLIKQSNCLYKACPAEGCKKKIIDQSNGMYRCEKCSKEYPNFSYRLLASANLVDWTDNQWVTAFGDQAESLLNMSAQQLGELKDSDETAFTEKIGEAAFNSHIFKIQVKAENYNDEMRLKSVAMAVQPINYKVYNDHLLSKIKELANVKA